MLYTNACIRNVHLNNIVFFTFTFACGVHGIVLSARVWLLATRESCPVFSILFPLYTKLKLEKKSKADIQFP